MLSLTAAELAFLKTETETEVAFKLEILDWATGDIIRTIDSRIDDGGLMLMGGSVTVDTGQEVLRTANLQLDDPNQEVDVGVNGLFGLDKLFRIWKGCYIPAQNGWTFWPLGVFAINAEPEINAAGGQRVIHLQLGDKSCGANGRPRGGFITKALTVSQGVKKLDALGLIAGWETWNEPPANRNFWPDSTATVGWDQSWEDRDSPWAAAQRIASIPEPSGTITRLYYDAYGRLTLAPDPGPNLDVLPAVWSAKAITDGLSQLVSANRILDVFKLRNAVKVKWGSTLTTPGEALAYDNNPNSPTYVGRIKWIPEWWLGGQQDELIRNLAEGQARADFELRRLLSYQERVPFTILDNPALEPWDVLDLGEPTANILGNHQLLSFTIPLDNSGVMQCQGWKVRRLG